jgi:large subunit ribosomal protein L16
MEVTAYKKKFKKKKIIKITTKFLGLIQFGYYGIKSMSSGILNHKQVENIRRIYVKVSKKIGKLFIRIFFQHPLTTKPLLSRMGKGVGSIKI